MMKKIIVLGAFIGILIFIVLVLQQPKEFNVEKSITINKNRSEIFAQVYNLKNWKDWSAWFQNDPLIKLIYSENLAEKGSYVTWESDKEGSGTQTITDSVGVEFIKLKLEYQKPFKGVVYSYFKFKELTETSSEVFWLVEAKNNSFMDKLYYFIINTESIIAKNLDQSLKNLKKLTEAQSPDKVAQ